MRVSNGFPLVQKLAKFGHVLFEGEKVQIDYLPVQELASTRQATSEGFHLSCRVWGEMGCFLGTMSEEEHGMPVKNVKGISRVLTADMTVRDMYRVLQKLGYAS